MVKIKFENYEIESVYQKTIVEEGKLVDLYSFHLKDLDYSKKFILNRNVTIYTGIKINSFLALSVCLRAVIKQTKHFSDKELKYFRKLNKLKKLINLSKRFSKLGGSIDLIFTNYKKIRHLDPQYLYFILQEYQEVLIPYFTPYKDLDLETKKLGVFKRFDLERSMSMSNIVKLVLSNNYTLVE